MEKLFVYGTLQIPEVQQHVFNRVTQGSIDVLEGYRKMSITLGEGTYPIIEPDEGNQVEGFVLEVTDDELQRIDIYETSAYSRIQVMLKSGAAAWVYCRP